MGYIYMLQARHSAAESMLGGCESKMAKYLLAKCKYSMGKFDESVELLGELEECWSKPSSEDFSILFHLSLPDVRKLLGQSLEDLGKVSKAVSYLAAAFEKDNTLLHCIVGGASANTNENIVPSSEHGLRTKKARLSAVHSSSDSQMHSNLLQEFLNCKLLKEGRFSEASRNIQGSLLYTQAARAYCLHESRLYSKVSCLLYVMIC
jgi:tetratricopeptide (TPR) repeat protein